MSAPTLWKEEVGDKPTSLAYRFIRFGVWLFSPKWKLSGAEKLPEGPCVIVGNHSQMYGPIAGELYTPGRHWVWCAGEMMHKEEVAAYAYRDFWSGKPKAVRWFYRLLSHLIVPLSVCVFNNAHTVAVYHDARALATFRDSAQKLRDGDRLVVFPECYDEHNHIVHAFQDRFIDLGRMYYKQTKRALPFVPLYVAPALGVLTFGEPILYDPAAVGETERSRISNARPCRSIRWCPIPTSPSGHGRRTGNDIDRRRLPALFLCRQGRSGGSLATIRDRYPALSGSWSTPRYSLSVSMPQFSTAKTSLPLLFSRAFVSPREPEAFIRTQVPGRRSVSPISWAPGATCRGSSPSTRGRFSRAGRPPPRRRAPPAPSPPGTRPTAEAAADS